MNTPLPAIPPPPSAQPQSEAPASGDTDAIRRRTGSGGFISVTSICGLVDHRPKRKGYWTHFKGTHPGR